LSCNGLNGSLPTRGLRTLSKLQCLNLGNNSICGKISADVSRLTSLVVLNLSTNQFTGKIPSQASCLTCIKKLDLHSNSLTGCLESVLFIKYIYYCVLCIFLLYSNNLSIYLSMKLINLHSHILNP
jgi:hypothetical protein